LSYIARRNPDAAVRLGDTLISRVEQLRSFPESGRVVPEFGRKDIRELIHLSYRIIYRVNRKAEEIQIVRFWHGARGFPHIPQR
jgi:plasmid stabilization system protein ParE